MPNLFDRRDASTMETVVDITQNLTFKILNVSFLNFVGVLPSFQKSQEKVML